MNVKKPFCLPHTKLNWPSNYATESWYWMARSIPLETRVSLLSKNTLIDCFLRKWYSLMLQRVRLGCKIETDDSCVQKVTLIKELSIRVKFQRNFLSRISFWIWNFSSRYVFSKKHSDWQISTFILWISAFAEWRIIFVIRYLYQSYNFSWVQN